MTLTQLVFTIYGGILLLGAYMGWKAGSKISLIMGAGSGLFVFFAVYLTVTRHDLGYTVLAVISGLLSVVFLMRFIKTRKMMPSGMLLGINIAAFILSLYCLQAI
jgi:uncharacterized membrane protein (UPF0136 family)